MLVTNIYKNVCRSRLLGHGGSFWNLRHIFGGRITGQAECKKPRKTDELFFTSSYKNYCSQTQTDPVVVLPPLCDEPFKVWPQLIGTIRNFFVINMVLKQSIDREFNEREFVKATEHALHVVSMALANDDYESLEGMVTQEAVNNVKRKISTLNYQQKRLIAVAKDDIYLTFPWRVTLMNEHEGREGKFVEIIMAHHYMHGLNILKNEKIPFTNSSSGLHYNRTFFANYRYLRDYTEGIDSSWIINMVNHVSLKYLAEKA